MDYGNIVIYKDKNELNNIEVKMIDNDVWLNQEQLVNLYNSSKSNISEHIKHIFEEGELDKDSVVRKFRTTAKDGKSYNAKYYNLDMIVAIGFRVKSNIDTNFKNIVEKIKEQINPTQYETFKNANMSLLKLYHNIGKTISEKFSWVNNFIEVLATKLKITFQNIKAFQLEILKV